MTPPKLYTYIINKLFLYHRSFNTFILKLNCRFPQPIETGLLLTTRIRVLANIRCGLTMRIRSLCNQCCRLVQLVDNLVLCPRRRGTDICVPISPISRGAGGQILQEFSASTYKDR